MQLIFAGMRLHSGRKLEMGQSTSTVKNKWDGKKGWNLSYKP